MANIEELKKELKELIQEGNTTGSILKEDKKLLDFSLSYQLWYTKAYKIVEFLAKDRLDEFVSYYLIDIKRKEIDVGNYVIQDYINGRIPMRNGKPRFDIKAVISIKFLNQINILMSLQTRIDSIFADIQGVVLSEILDKELEAAKQLLKDYPRAAGAVTGVVLEAHLQKVANNHSIKSAKKNPTIADLNEILKSSNIYDVTVWRKIQYLGDLRNLCSHKKDNDPTIDQITELIQGVNSIIKTIF